MKEINIEGKFGKFSLSLPEDISEDEVLTIHSMIIPLLNGDKVNKVVGSFMPGHNDCCPQPTFVQKYKILFCFKSDRSFEKLKVASALKSYFDYHIKEAKDIVDGVTELKLLSGSEMDELTRLFHSKGIGSYEVTPVVVEDITAVKKEFKEVYSESLALTEAAIGTGKDEDGNLTIEVRMTKDMPGRFPNYFMGHKVRTKYIGGVLSL